ncbi:sphingolipid delta(4)-desaturase DES1 [Folsomia candida]|uniref:sphingolipid delta(4)-desaturase DES1 n=1 Tax=Folsomia candida TaxID=158441 RepID=UPI000B8F642C|nr:sphingolipid delta(4)-desaturase DES1 [Folsomia candida]
MGQHVSRTDFEWTESLEPHAVRRTDILKKYPQIRELFKPDENMKWKVTLLVFIQFVMIAAVSEMSWTYIILLAYCFGGVINHALTLAVHEIAHNLAFGHSRPMANRMLGMFANLPIAIPMSISFKKYHLEHHRYQGDEVFDTDIPTYFEAKLFCTTVGKFFWLLLQPLFYALRPLLVYPKPPSNLEIINAIIQLSFDFAVFHFFGGKSLLYLFLGTLLALGLHPVAGHFVAEHYMFHKGYETYSYYGILNCVTFNVGYHNEHHDFPAVPGCNLPKLREIAKDYYDTLPHHDSWVQVLYDFVMDPEIGPYARIKRKNRDLAKEIKDAETFKNGNGLASTFDKVD